MTFDQQIKQKTTLTQQRNEQKEHWTSKSKRKKNSAAPAS